MSGISSKAINQGEY